MVDSKKPSDKSKDAASKYEEQPKKQNISSAERAAKAKAFVSAQKLDQQKSDQADYSDAGTNQKGPRTGLLWFFLLCTLGLSGAAGYGVYYLWQQWQVEQGSTQALEGELQATQTAVANVGDDLRKDLRDDFDADFKALQAEFDEQSTAREEELTATKNKLSLLEKTVGRQTRQMDALTQTNRDEWLLAETEYLLRLANQRILMSKEISGPLAMLQSADKILRDIDDMNLVPVRRAIADDVAALSRTEAVDIDGEYLSLASLAGGIDELNLYDIPEFSNEEPEAPIEASMPEQPTWRDSVAQVGGAIKQTLGKVFVVRQRNQPIEAMLPPQQELYLRQNLRLMLEQAQVALLARKPDIYQQSLDKAQQWIGRYFIGEEAATQAALETLERARTINIDPPLPDISGSYRALKDYTDTEYSRKIEAETAQQLQQGKKPQPEVQSAAPAQSDTAQEPKLKTEPAAQQEPAPEAETEAESDAAAQPQGEAKPEQQPAKALDSSAKPADKPARESTPEPQAKPEEKPAAAAPEEESATQDPDEKPAVEDSEPEPEPSAEDEGADASEEV